MIWQLVFNMLYGIKHFLRVGGIERGFAGQQSVQDNANTPNVNFLPRIALSGNLLR